MRPTTTNPWKANPSWHNLGDGELRSITHGEHIFLKYSGFRKKGINIYVLVNQKNHRSVWFESRSLALASIEADDLIVKGRIS